jgi:hypothetical protein
LSKTGDFSIYEDENKFMEGTGSVVFNHIAKKAYLCLSERSDKNVFEEICSYLGYQAVSFTATDSAGMLIYHTNVLMCVTDKLVIICLEAVKDTAESVLLHDSLKNSGKIIVEISLSQMANFAGNMLGLMASNETLLAMSAKAIKVLSTSQITQIEQFHRILLIEISTIETIGGGSVRCMMAEIFLPSKIQ